MEKEGRRVGMDATNYNCGCLIDCDPGIIVWKRHFKGRGFEEQNFVDIEEVLEEVERGNRKVRRDKRNRELNRFKE